MERMQRQHDDMQQQRKFFGQQLADKQQRLKEERERDAKDQIAWKLRIEQQERDETLRLQAKYEAKQQEMKRVLEDNKRRLHDKAIQLELQKQEEQRINKEYMDSMAAKEAKRVADLEAIREKQRRKFELGGGAALSKGLEEKAKQDEERAEMQAAEYERKLAQDQKRRQDDIQNRNKFIELSFFLLFKDFSLISLTKFPFVHLNDFT
eukprot:TRINITY_DN61014_c0_g1_i1.p1 TRINITY_DN61014_c0_g1~~TRINITY_DN61014_c0_g1_i1.p1  ORF type:complete len:235 (-),score=41.24 TRINITY_DN61014_c0_g1_i1:43-666(-)